MYGGTAAISVVLAFVAFIAACLSPLINLLALVGGAVATVLAKPESDVTQQQMTKAI